MFSFNKMRMFMHLGVIALAAVFVPALIGQNVTTLPTSGFCETNSTNCPAVLPSQINTNLMTRIALTEGTGTPQDSGPLHNSVQMGPGAAAPTWTSQGVTCDGTQQYFSMTGVGGGKTVIWASTENVPLNAALPEGSQFVTAWGLTDLSFGLGGNQYYGSHPGINQFGSYNNQSDSTLQGTHVFAFTFGTNPSTDPDRFYIDGVETTYGLNRTATAAGIPTSSVFNACGIGAATFPSYFPGSFYYIEVYSDAKPAVDIAKETSVVTSILKARGVQFSPKLSQQPKNIYIAIGDSLTNGENVSPSSTFITPAETFDVVVHGLGNSGTDDNLLLFDVRDAILFRPKAGRNVARIWLGTNDVSTLGTTPLQALNGVRAMCRKAKLAGFETIASDMISRVGNDPNMLALNALLTTQDTGCDIMLDLASNPSLGAVGANTNATIYQGDNTHLLTAGQQIVAAAETRAIDLLGSVNNKIVRPTVTTSTYTMVDSDLNLLVDPTTQSVAVTLPDCMYFTGFTHTVKNLQVTGANTVTVAPTSGQSVDGSSSLLTVENQGVLTVRSIVPNRTTAGCSWIKVTNSSSGSGSSGITALTGDGTASGTGSVVFTLANVNTHIGGVGSASSIPTFTVNSKGLITTAGSVAVVAPAGTLSGTALSSTVLSSSLTSFAGGTFGSAASHPATDFAASVTPTTTSDGIAVDTVPAQAAQPSGFVEGNPFASGSIVTTPIGLNPIFKAGQTLTGALNYNSSNDFAGNGAATDFLFCGTANAQNFMQPNTASFAWGSTQDFVKFRNFRVDNKPSCGFTPNYAFYINNTNRAAMYDVYVGSGFNTGLWLDQTALSSSGSYYNSYTNLNIMHATAQSVNIAAPVNSTNFFGGDFRDGSSDAYKTSGYNVVENYNGSTTAPLYPQSTNFFGTALEGNLTSTGAQVKVEGPTWIFGTYNETPKGVDPTNNPTGAAATVDIDMTPYVRNAGNSGIKGDLNHILMFHNFAAPQIGSLLSGSMVFPPEVDEGNPKFLDICDNCNLHNGTWNFAPTAGGANGTLVSESNALGLDGQHAFLETFTGTTFGATYGVGWKIPAAQLTPYVGQWIYLNVWVQDGTNTPVASEQLIVNGFGAGVTQGNSMQQWRTKIDNGEYLYVVPINVMSAADFNVTVGWVSNAATGTSVHILGAEITKDGWEALPIYRPNAHRCSNVAPTDGTWFAGDICQNISPVFSTDAALYLNYTAGSPGSWTSISQGTGGGGGGSITLAQIQALFATDTTNSSAWGFRTGSGGDSTLPSPLLGVDYLGMHGGILSKTHGTQGFAPLLTLSCQPGIGDGLNPIAAATYKQVTCKNKTGFIWTIQSISAFADIGSSTMNVVKCLSTDTTVCSAIPLLTGFVTGTNSYSSGTQTTNTTLAPGDYLTFIFIADGVTTQMTAEVSGIY